MSLFCWTQRKIFWRMWETAVLGTIDFHSIFFSYYGSQWCPKTAWLQTFFKITSFVFSRTKKFIQVWNYLRVSKWWQNFNFWVNYPFKTHCSANFISNLFQHTWPDIFFKWSWRPWLTGSGVFDRVVAKLCRTVGSLAGLKTFGLHSSW